jgi:uncharacterized phiE125 gp8 family phage protein
MRSLIDTFNHVVDEPTALALTVANAKLSIKSHSSLEDALIESWIRGAMQDFTEETGRDVITTRRELWLDEPPVQRIIELPFPPLQRVESVSYVDGNGDVQSFADTTTSPETPYYQVKTPSGVYAQRGWIELNPTANWPTTLIQRGALRIRYISGYGDTEADVPELVKTVLRYMVGSFDGFRSETYAPRAGGSMPERIPFGVQHLIRGFKYTALETMKPRRFL